MGSLTGNDKSTESDRQEVVVTDEDTGTQQKVDTGGRSRTSNFVLETAFNQMLKELRDIKYYLKSIAED